MQLGLVGPTLSGKSTLFRLLTGLPAAPSGARDAQVGVAPVPDPRLDALAEMYHPKKLTPATMQLTDVAGLPAGHVDRTRLNEFFDHVRKSDALLFVAAAFPEAAAAQSRDEPDPVTDVRGVQDELVLADLDRVETVSARLAKNHRRSGEEERTLALLERCRIALEDEQPLRGMGLSADEHTLLRGYSLLTEKPAFVAVNVGEGQLRAGGEFPGREALAQYCADRDLVSLEFCGTVESEISDLPAEERPPFLAEYGLDEPGVNRLARAAQQALGLISFLTAGEDEVRAWPIAQGTVAKDAAGKIHSDIARGFIRAEVVAFDDLVRLGSNKACRDEGLLRLEGKEYVVRDGDVINFRFNV